MRALALRLRRAMVMLTSFRINSRALLLVLICGGQLCCMLAALAGFSRWLARDLLKDMQQQVLASNQDYAAQMVDTIRRLKVPNLRLGGTDWERVQKLVERTKVPNDGFVCVVEGDEGRIICHPQLRTHAALLSFQIGTKTLHHSDGGESPVMAAARGDATAAGWVEMPDGRHLVAVRDVPELNVRVIALQREGPVVQVIGHLNASAAGAGILFAVLAALGTAGLTLIIVRLYEHRLATLNKGLEMQVEQRGRALVRTRDAVIFGLAHLAESRHESTGEHLARVSGFVDCLARELARSDPALGLDERMIHTIAVASSLHDIGKVAIPDNVLLKPGRLTPQQRSVMKEHTIIGGRCLQTIKQRLGDDEFLNIACQIALSHHERWNGEGYPVGLQGEEIPLAARIVAVADVYDALTSERVYKRAMTHGQARGLIVRASGRQFDPMVVDAFLRIEHEFARIAGHVDAKAEAPMKAAA